jgi:hypothetical protein
VDDLFRFFMLRPAAPVSTDQVRQLVPSFVESGTQRPAAPAAQRLARDFTTSGGFVVQGMNLAYADPALKVVAALRSGPLPAAQISSLVQAATGTTVADLTSKPAFADEEKRIVDTLVAMKLLSNSTGGDAPGLYEVEQGYDAMKLAAAGRDLLA